MQESTAIFEYQLSKAQVGLKNTRAAVANFLPTHQADYDKFYQRLIDSTQKHPFLRALSLEGIFTGKTKKKRTSSPNLEPTLPDPYDIRRANLRRAAMIQYREYAPESLDREVAQQAAAGFSLLLELLDRPDLASCFLEHVMAKTAIKEGPVYRFKSYRADPTAQDIFGVIQLAVNCGLAVPDEPTTQLRNQQLNLFAAAVAYSQTRLGQILDVENVKKHPRFDKPISKEERRVSRDQILIFALAQLNEVNSPLLNYLLHLHDAL